MRGDSKGNLMLAVVESDFMTSKFFGDIGILKWRSNIIRSSFYIDVFI